MLLRRTLLLFAAVTSFGLTGCVDGTVRVTVLEDGAGSIAIDLGYGVDKWPAMFGDPLAGFRTREQLRDFLEPGMVAWSEPEITATDVERRWRGEVFFDDVGRLQFLGRRQDQVIEAMGFGPDLDAGRIDLRPGFLVYLDDPLPLPTPDKVGMSEVSLSPALLEAIRQRIRPVIEGLDVKLVLELPGTITRAAGFDAVAGRTAVLRVDDDRLARAFATEAGVLTDEAALREDPTWRWEGRTSNAGEDLRHRRAQALDWWNAD